MTWMMEDGRAMVQKGCPGLAVETKRPRGTFVISDGTVDRDGDRVSVDGWELPPTVPLLFGHDHARVLGIARPYRRGSQVLADVEIADSSPDAAYMRELLDMGALSASVGFRPTAPPLSNGSGLDFSKQELLELSLLPVPSNARARQIKAALEITICGPMPPLREESEIVVCGPMRALGQGGGIAVYGPVDRDFEAEAHDRMRRTGVLD